MARIAFFTELLPPDSDPIADFSFDLIRTLADQDHEVRVLSTYREGAELPPPHPRIEIMRPFRDWSWWELPKIVPILSEFRPEILHLIQPRARALSGWTNALSALPSLTPLLGRPAVISSFYDLRESELKAHRPLLIASHAITVSSEPQHDMAARFLVEHGLRAARIAIVPVVAHSVAPSSDQTSADEMPDALRAFLGSGRELVFIPGDISAHREPERLFTEIAEMLEERVHSGHDTIVLFGGGWGGLLPHARFALMRPLESRGLGARVLVSGPLSEGIERRCLQKARVVFTASLPPESLRLTQILALYLSEAASSLALLVIDEAQAERDAIPWRHGENAVVARGPRPGARPEWRRALLEALDSPDLAHRIRARLPDFSRMEAMDQPGNVMSRIYAQLLERR